MDNWQATHRISTDFGTYWVMAVEDDDGTGLAAYSKTEWDGYLTADFTANAAGEWLFQGQPFNGKVEALA